MKIRKAEIQDLEAIEAVYASARAFMEQTGNPNQWGKHHPPREQIERAIQAKKLYVLEENGAIHGSFYFAIEEEPNYQRIDEGDWLSDEPYGVIHMVASDGQIHGFVQKVVAFCEQQTKHLRIDTHHDNKVMQHVIEKNGFTRCGIIYLLTENGDPRIAYEKLGE